MIPTGRPASEPLHFVTSDTGRVASKKGAIIAQLPSAKSTGKQGAAAADRWERLTKVRFAGSRPKSSFLAVLAGPPPPFAKVAAQVQLAVRMAAPGS